MDYSFKRKLNVSKLIICLILLLVCFVLVYLFFTSFLSGVKQTKEVSIPSDSSVVEPETKDTSISVAVIGDIMCHNTQYTDAYQKNKDSYDFSYVFTEIKPYIESSDLSIGNLETTFAGKSRGYSSYPSFNTPEQLAQNLKDLGIDVLSTANNHSLDKGYSGIENTILELDKVGILHTGTYISKEKQNEIITKDVNGIKIAFLSFTYGTNGIPIPKGKDYCINLIDKNLILNQITKAKETGADLIFANMHWGAEYQLKPNTEQKDLADFLFENGVDVILGSHPHVLQPMEKREITLKDGTKKDGFVIYSLGNFMSGQTKANTKNSIILNLKITKHADESFSIDSVTYTPIYCYSKMNGETKFKLIDIKKSIQDYENGTPRFVSSSLYETLKKELTNIEKVVGEEITN